MAEFTPDQVAMMEQAQSFHRFRSLLVDLGGDAEAYITGTEADKGIYIYIYIYPILDDST